jgi:hypothetical protein
VIFKGILVNTGLTALRSIVGLVHVIISWFLKTSDSNWAALLAWEILKTETGVVVVGERPFVICLKMNHPWLEPISMLDSFSHVTLKSGSALPFPFPFFVPLPTSTPALPSTTPFTLVQRRSEFGSFYSLLREDFFAFGPPHSCPTL